MKFPSVPLPSTFALQRPVPLAAVAPADGAAAATEALARHRRIDWLDAAKGIGILLVVLGHSLGGLHDAGMVADGSALLLLFTVIYVFHMPLFFFLSASLVEPRIRANQRRFLTANLTRIAYPYFLWGTLQTLILLAAAGLVNHPPAGGAVHQVLRALWSPPGQFWFLYALFFLHAAAVVCVRLGGKLLLGVAFALLYLVCTVSAPVAAFVTGYISLSCILFYVLGVCFGDALLGWRGNVGRPYGLMLLGAIVCVAGGRLAFATHADFFAPAMLPAAFAGTAVVVLLARRPRVSHSAWLIHLGRRSMPIYLLHVIFVAGTRIVLAKLLLIDSTLIVLPTIFAAGVAGPLLVYATARRLHLQHALGLG